MVSEIQKSRITRAIQTFNSLTHYPMKIDKEIADLEEFELNLISQVKEKKPDAIFPFIPLENLIEAYIQLKEASARSRLKAPPWSVVGRSNYKGNPEKAHRITEKALENLKAREKQFERSLKKLEIPEFASEIERVEHKISQLEKAQVTMKTINAIVRKHKKNLEEAIPEIIAAGLKEESAKEIIKPDFAGRIGFASYALTNNNAEIKRNKDRLVRLKSEEVREEKDVTIEGVRIVDNKEADRIQVFYDAIPSAEIRQTLKKRGFNYSPSNKAWQRKRTDNTRSVIKEIYGVQL